MNTSLISDKITPAVVSATKPERVVFDKEFYLLSDLCAAAGIDYDTCLAELVGTLDYLEDDRPGMWFRRKKNK